MRRVGQTRKRDANEQVIVEALRAIGAKVFRISGVGVPDLLVYYRDRWQPLEVKSKGGKLTEEQGKAFMESPFPIVRDVDQALSHFVRKRA